MVTSVQSVLETLSSAGHIERVSVESFAPSPGQSTLGSNEKLSLFALVQRMQPDLVVCVSGAESGARLRELLALADEAGATGLAVLTVRTDGASPRGDHASHAARALSTDAHPIYAATSALTLPELAQHLRTHDARLDLLVIDENIAQPVIEECLSLCREIMSERGAIHGAAMSTVAADAILALATTHHLDVTLGRDFWQCAWGKVRRSQMRSWLSGVPQAVVYDAIAEACAPAPSRERFLQCASEGIPCRFDLTGGVPYENRLPENIVKSSPEVRAAFSQTFNPPYEATGVSEGGLLAFMRNVRMQGDKGYLYSPRGALYEESFGAGRAHVQSMKTLIARYEPILRETVAAAGPAQWYAMAALTAPTARITAPHVLAMYADLYIYHHWMAAVLPRFWYLDEFPELIDVPIVTGPFVSKYQLEYLSMLGILEKARFVFYTPSLGLHFDRAFVPTLVDRPHHVARTVNWLRGKFIPQAGKVPSGYEGGRYYISRRDGGRRNMVNEQEIIGYLSGFGFQVVEWSAFSVREQIALARDAKVIVGGGGSSMSNTVYTSPGCKILEIMPDDMTALETRRDWMLTFAIPEIGARLYSMSASSATAGGHATTADMRVDMGTFKALFTRMMDESIVPG